LARNVPVSIVAIGDSITFGKGVATEERYTPVLADLLTQRVGNKITVRNAGVNSDIATNALQRFDEDVLKHAPDFAVILFGVNDAGFFRPDGPPADTPRVSLPEFHDAIETMIEHCGKAGVRPVLATPAPMSSSYWLAFYEPYQQNGLNYLVHQYAEEIRAIAREREILLADVCAAFENHAPEWEEWIPDGIHPNAKGHALIARVIADAMEKDARERAANKA